MANEPAHSPLAPEPSDRKVLYSAIAWIGVIFMFLFIVLITYVPNRSGAISEEDIKARQQILAQVDADQEKKATTYQWINETGGQVRLPIDRARELIVPELQATQAES